MSDPGPRLLFVPVSGEFGMGEYARSLAIAQGALNRWPAAAIRFVLSRRAPYADSAPFPVTLLDSSPTFHSDAIAEILKTWRPDIVVFDNAGRTAQLRAAKRAGACVVFISSRRRQRRKAFRLGWMRIIDEHWIAYPKFIAGALGPLERAKLAWLGRPQVRYLDVILAPPCGPAVRGHAPAGSAASDGYVLVVPGGATGHPGVSDAVDRFLAAARALAASGVETRFVGRSESVDAATTLKMLGVLPQGQLAELMRGARLIIANGGSTLLQSIACGAPCLAVPIARDQSSRISRCVGAGVAVFAPLEAGAIEASALRLLRDGAALRGLAARAAALQLTNGVDLATRALSDLLAAK